MTYRTAAEQDEERATQPTRFQRFEARLSAAEAFLDSHIGFCMLGIFVGLPLMLAIGYGGCVAVRAVVEDPSPACAESRPVDGMCPAGSTYDKRYVWSGAVCRCRP